MDLVACARRGLDPHDAAALAAKESMSAALEAAERAAAASKYDLAPAAAVPLNSRQRRRATSPSLAVPTSPSSATVQRAGE